jgi:molybdopterin/thiamine biosynthesis adenylyltransferase
VESGGVVRVLARGKGSIIAGRGAVMDVEVLQEALAAAAAGAMGESVAIVGLGNIGSFLADLLGRAPEVKCITLVDGDVYEEKNRGSQNIAGAGAVGKAKVEVMARRLKAMRGDLRIEAWAARVEDVPLGRLKVDVICGCLDSRLARVHVNRAARVLGVAWVDAGVEPSSLLARVNVYRPGMEWPCYECGFSGEDYRRLEVTYPCGGGRAGAAATHAPASLGALAAGLQAIEAMKVLRGQWSMAAVGRQITMAAGAHRYYVTTMEVNRRCRCGHEAWAIEPAGVGARDTVRRMMEVWPGSEELAVYGQTFVRQMACGGCAYRSREQAAGRLSGRLTRRGKKCPRCGGMMQAVGFCQTDGVELGKLWRRDGERRLGSMGLADGDVVTLRGEGAERHVLLGAAGGARREQSEGRAL